MPIQADVQIDIHAPAEQVWQTMVDFERYGEWNPFIVGVDTEKLSSPLPQVGDRLTLHVEWTDEEGGSQSSGERITVYQPPGAGQDGELSYRFTGWMHGLGLVRATRVQRIATLPSGDTRYSSLEVFRGLLSSAIPLARVQAGFNAHAQALKSTVEATTAPYGSPE